LVELPAAGIRRRMVALAIDFVLSFVLVFALISAGDEAGDEPSRWVELAAAVAFFAVVGLYFIVGNLLGRTPGMLIAGCRVVDAAGRLHLRLWQALGRAALTMLLCFSFAWVATAEESQATLNVVFGVVLAISAIGRLWMLVAADRRTLFDRLLRVRVVVQEPAVSGTGATLRSKTNE
jgi:uncharacterized RDD family membrane protein YckC